MSIQSVKRVCEILSVFSVEKSRWGNAEIANALGLAKTTVSSLVRTLGQTGFLAQDPDTRRYGLGPRLFALGIIAGETLEINQKAHLAARDLAERTGLICRVAIWDGDAALLTLEFVPKEAEFLARRIGPRIVPYGSSLGRAMLAHIGNGELKQYLKTVKMVPFTPHTVRSKDHLLKELKKTRTRGYAVNNQELVFGHTSLAAPIFGRDGEVVAAVNLVGSPERMLGSEMETLAGHLQNTATEISRLMGYGLQFP